MLSVASLIIAELLPASLLTPMARDPGISKGLAGQSVTVTALPALVASLLTSKAIHGFDRRVAVVSVSVLLTASSLIVAFVPGRRHAAPWTPFQRPGVTAAMFAISCMVTGQFAFFTCMRPFYEHVTGRKTAGLSVPWPALGAATSTSGVESQLESHLGIGRNTGITDEQLAQIADLVDSEVTPGQINFVT